jgi:hypothetical protein
MREFMLKYILLMILAITSFGPMVPPALCEEKAASGPGFDSTEALIELLKAKKIITEEEAAKFMDRRRAAPDQDKKVIMIIPEEEQKALQEKITEEVLQKVQKDIQKVKEDLDYNTDDLLKRSRNAEKRVEELDKKVTEDVGKKLEKSSWAQRIRWGGDVRLRYEGDSFDENNALLLQPDDPTKLMNTREDRQRFRYRVRLGVKAVVMEKDPELNVGKVEAEVKLATGNEKDPVSTNDTLGDYYNKDGIVVDLAYLKWTYSPTEPVWGQMPEFTLTGGRLPNLWFSTDLVWDSDLNFEGLALGFKTNTLLSNPWTGFLTLGAFPLQEVELAAEDKWLYGVQAGVEYKKAMGLSARVGVAYYDFKNIVGEANDPLRPNEKDYTAPLYQQKGNTLFDIDPSAGIKTALASEFKELNLTAELDYDYWFPIHLTLLADYVKNLGFDRDEVVARTGVSSVSEETQGYQIGLKVGYPKPYAFGDWNLFLYYKHLEADAVVDAFTDSDFHLGGTNAKGWIFGGELGLHRNLSLKARWLTADEIEGPPLAIDVFQLDLNAKF